jgi:hypothetical protein
MARLEITNADFRTLLADIDNQKRTSPAFGFFLKEKINRFYQQNAMCIKILNKFMADNIKTYVEHDSDGKPMIEERDGGHFYKFETPEKEKEYLEKANEFMGRTILVEA